MNKKIKEITITIFLENEDSQMFNLWLHDCFHELNEFYTFDAINSGIVFRFPNLYANGLKDTSSVIDPLYDNQSRMGQGILIKWIEVGARVEKGIRLKVMITFPFNPRIIKPVLAILFGLRNDFPDAQGAIVEALRDLKNTFQIEDSILPLDVAQPIENKNLVVKLNRNDVYRQLLAMCNDGKNYSLQQGDYKDKELECLSVADRKAITEHPNTTAKNKIIGYIRLLPNNSDTLITFVHKNRPEWHDYPVINPELWESFINAVFEYFKGNVIAAQVGTGKTVDRRQRGQSGRPNLSEDLWAWEQVNQSNRPMNVVYNEWLDKIKANPERCNMVDPKRQFNRITKPEWGNKSGQNI